MDREKINDVAKIHSSQLGVFDTMEEAILACSKAYTVFKKYNKEQREKIINEIRQFTHAEAEKMSELAVAETDMGNVYHKILKHHLVADKTPGLSAIATEANSGDRGLTLTEKAPYGLIGAFVPMTNPSSTIICNSICMLAGGNGVVFNPNKHAVGISSYAVDLINRAVVKAGGPVNVVCTIKNPTDKSAEMLMKSDKVKMLVVTGGTDTVKRVMQGGKRVVGAGSGNPPVAVDDTADIPKAAKDITDGCSFDNNLPCICEKECFVMENVADELIENMLKNGAYLINDEQIRYLEELVLTYTKSEKGKTIYVPNRDFVGKSAKEILSQIGIYVDKNVKCIICETEFSHPFVLTELMMPILPIVRTTEFDDIVEMAVKAEGGRGLSASLHSKDIDNMTRFAKTVDTAVFVKNAPSYAGIGFNAEGFTSFTIASLTGEGMTSPVTFTRDRRCVVSDAFNIL